MRIPVIGLLLALLFSVLPVGATAPALHATPRNPLPSADAESDHLIVAWQLPLLIAASSSQAIDQCVRQAFAVSRWNTRLTGTLSYATDPDGSYTATPRDRLRVIYENSAEAEFWFQRIEGNTGAGPDEFFNGAYRMECRAASSPDADLHLAVSRNGSAVTTAASGSLLFAGITYAIEVEATSDIYFESSFGGSEYRNRTAVTGQASADDFSYTFDENLFYHSVGFEGESASQNQRSLNGQWRVGRTGFTLTDGWLTQSFKDGKPSRMDTEWRTAGTVQRANRLWGQLGGQLDRDYFHVQAQLSNSSITLQSIPLTSSAPPIPPAISGQEPGLTSRTPDGTSVWQATDTERMAIAVRLLAFSFGMDEESMAEIVALMGVDDDTMAAYLVLTARNQNNSLEYASAAALLQEALDDLRSRDTEGIEASLRAELGRTLIYQGQSSAALTELERALLLYERTDDPEQQAVVLTNMAYIYDGRAEYEQALSNYLDALAVYEELIAEAESAKEPSLAQEFFDIRSKFNHNVIYNNIGSLYATLGEPDKAIAAYQRAVAISKAGANQAGQASALHNLGQLYIDTGDYSLAEETLTEALDIADTRFDPNSRAHILVGWGNLYSAEDEADKALDKYAEAESIFISTGNGPGAALAVNQMAIVHAQQEEYEEAIALWQQSLAFYMQEGFRTDEATLLSNLGYAQEEQGNLTEAVEFYTRAVDVIETIQGEIRIGSAKSAFLANAGGIYTHLIDLLWQLDRKDEAFAFAERAKARTFLATLANTPLSVGGEEAAGLLAQEAALRSRIYELQNTLSAEQERSLATESDRSAQLGEELRAARAEYETLLTRIQLASPELAAMTQIGTIALDDVPRQALDNETTLIVYFVLEDRTLAWVIDRNRIRTAEIAVGRSELARAINRLSLTISAERTVTTQAGELYRQLIDPLTRHIRHEKVVIVPHDALHYLPFSALWNSRRGRYLVEEYTLSYAPSASALPFLQEKANPNEGQLLILGDADGDLSYAGAEVEAIAALYDTRAYVGRLATESRFRANAPQADILHLAVHGVYQPSTPLFSRLGLAPGSGHDGFLEVHEILGLDLQNANLVVLSACESAVGDRTDGDEIVGLTRAFLTAGAPAVLSTLWSIDDAASAYLMEQFHAYLLKEEMSAAQALRQAQLDTLAQNGWDNPHFWAAFTLTGETQ